MINQTFRINIGRLLIFFVVFFNLECALLFIFNPGQFTNGFLLSGIVGSIMVRSMGILFLMWNVPYIFALVSPLIFRNSLIEAIIMQSIGLCGEVILVSSLTSGYQVLKETAHRFILFDGFGIAALVIAFLITKDIKMKQV